MNKEEFEGKVKDDLFEEPVEIKFRVVGVTFEGRQAVLKELDNVGGAEIVLQADLENEYDENAVAVYAKLGGGLKQAGYVPREGAPIVKKLLAHDGFEPEATMDWVSKGSKNTFGMHITIRFTPKGNVAKSVGF